MAADQLLDPRDYMITRKRKQYKFAKFFNSPLCFEFEEWSKQPADCIEVGAGTGLFSVELAERYPDKQFVAIDVKADRLQKGAYEAEAHGISNIRFLRARADQLAACFEPGSLEALWLTFPDPFPKKRAAGRRLTHPLFLAQYVTLLGKGGTMYLKHDSRDFFMWSLEQLVAEKWQLKELTFDLHDSNLSDDYKIMTTYETRWLGEGALISFVSAAH